jgi:hypothetical protein
MTLRHIPFPFLLIFGCVTLVWAMLPQRRSSGDKAASGSSQDEQDRAQAQSSGVSLTGVVSDSNCGARHIQAGEDAAHCVSRCVASGAKYVLVADGSVFQVDPQEQLAAYAGKPVTVKGSLRGDTITAATVSPAQRQN